MDDAAARDGLRRRRALLAAAPGLAEGRGMGGAPPSLARPARPGQHDRLWPLLARRRLLPGKGGELTGPNSTDRAKAGSKRHVPSAGSCRPLLRRWMIRLLADHGRCRRRAAGTPAQPRERPRQPAPRSFARRRCSAARCIPSARAPVGHGGVRASCTPTKATTTRACRKRGVIPASRGAGSRAANG
jgi:hypothetical protein